MPTPTLLLTRPRAQSVTFARALETALPGRFRTVVAPVLRIEVVAAEVDLEGARGLLFTSANGVEAFAARCADRSLPAFCVGDMTAAAARAAGFAARSAGGDVAALAALVAAEGPGPGAFVHVRGRHAAGDLTGRLAAAGVAARGLELYDQVPAALPGEAQALLGAGRVDTVAVFSPRSAALFARAAQAAGWDLGRAALVALSPAAAAAHDAPEPGRRIVAPSPTRAGMIAALAGL